MDFILSAVECADDVLTNTNVTVTKGDRGYLDTVTYTCLEGHYYDTSSKDNSHVSTCQADETWSLSGDQICVRKLLV